MDSIVKASIEARKNSLFQLYEINDQSFLNKIEEIIAEMEKLSENCLDSADFEAKLAVSPLNEKYIALFSEAATRFKSKVDGSVVENVNQGNMFVDTDTDNDTMDTLKEIADTITRPLRKTAQLEIDSAIREIPVVGDVIQASRIVDTFNNRKNILGKFKKNR